MEQIRFPERYREEFSELDWIAKLGRHEEHIMTPLGEWLRESEHSFDDITPGLKDELFFQDLKSGISKPNILWKEWGYVSSQMDGVSWLATLHPEDREPLYAVFSEYSRDKDQLIEQAVYRVKDTRDIYHWVLSTSIPVKRKAFGELHQYIGRDIEIGSRLDREIALRQYTEYTEDMVRRDRALVEAAGEIAGVTESKALHDAVDRTARSILNLDNFRLVVVGSRDSYCLLGQSLPEWLTHAELIAARKISSYKIFSGTSNGSRTERLVAWPLGEALDGSALAIFNPLGNISSETNRLMNFLAPLILRAWQQVERLNELRRQATTDTLTGAWNRRAFIQQASAALRNYVEEKLPSTVVMLDIDHFKLVNDEYGHNFGDRVLKHVAEGIMETLRGSDLLCRWGGEEFAVFLGNTDKDTAKTVVERIRSTASQRSGQTCRVTLSAGYRWIQADHPESLDSALNCADQALLKAKRNGRNRAFHCDENSQDLVLES